MNDDENKTHESNEFNINVEFPFLVGLISDGVNKNLTICTGTLLSAVFVLSSVYCTARLQTDRIKVRVVDAPSYYFNVIHRFITGNGTCCKELSNII